MAVVSAGTTVLAAKVDLSKGKDAWNMRGTLKHRFLQYFFSVLGFISCGAVFSMIVVSNIGDRTTLLVDKYWQDNNLIAQVHDVLGEVLLLLDLPPGSPEVMTTRHQLQDQIGKFIVLIERSTFREDFRAKQSTQLRQLRESLAAPAEMLAKVEIRQQIRRQIRVISAGFRERTEIFAKDTIGPTRGMIEESLSLISAVLLASIGIGGMFAASLSIHFAERISLPLEHAADTLVRIGQGDLAARVDPNGIAEIDKIGQAINALANSLQQTATRSEAESGGLVFTSEAASGRSNNIDSPDGY